MSAQSHLSVAFAWRALPVVLGVKGSRADGSAMKACTKAVDRHNSVTWADSDDNKELRRIPTCPECAMILDALQML